MSIASGFDYSSFLSKSYNGDPDRDWAPWMREKFLDIKHPLIDVLKGAAFGAFIRPLAVAARFFNGVNPQGFCGLTPLKKAFSLVQLTNNNIEKNLIYPQSLPNSAQSPSQARLKYLLNRVHALAQKMGIEKEIQVYAGEKCAATGANGGTFAISAPFILIATSEVNASDEELDWIIAHELVHINHNHPLKKTFFEGAVLVIDAIAVISIVGILLIPFIEGTASLAFRAISKSYEKEADIEAIRVLGTNTGAISSLEKEIARNREQKKVSKCWLLHSSNPKVQEELKSFSCTWDRIKNTFNDLTSSGNNRTDLNHPPLTTRLDYCKALTLSKSA